MLSGPLGQVHALVPPGRLGESPAPMLHTPQYYYGSFVDLNRGR